jgi:hypothetical protein
MNAMAGAVNRSHRDRSARVVERRPSRSAEPPSAIYAGIGEEHSGTAGGPPAGTPD